MNDHKNQAVSNFQENFDPQNTAEVTAYFTVSGEGNYFLRVTGYQPPEGEPVHRMEVRTPTISIEQSPKPEYQKEQITKHDILSGLGFDTDYSDNRLDSTEFETDIGIYLKHGRVEIKEMKQRLERLKERAIKEDSESDDRNYKNIIIQPPTDTSGADAFVDGVIRKYQEEKDNKDLKLELPKGFIEQQRAIRVAEAMKELPFLQGEEYSKGSVNVVKAKPSFHKTREIDLQAYEKVGLPRNQVRAIELSCYMETKSECLRPDEEFLLPKKDFEDHTAKTFVYDTPVLIQRENWPAIVEQLATVEGVEVIDVETQTEDQYLVNSGLRNILEKPEIGFGDMFKSIDQRQGPDVVGPMKHRDLFHKIPFQKVVEAHIDAQYGNKKGPDKTLLKKIQI
jgi:hypothetical protein